MAHDTHASSKSEIFNKVWIPFFILLAVTTLEFIIALAIPNSLMPHRPYKVVVYAVLTLLKAGYIVGFFMHLKFEKIGLLYAILVPTVFILGLVAALIFEGSALTY